MILWINGPFGVGKTTTAKCIQAQAPGWRLFDPEWVGYLLRAHLAGVAFDDFQDLPAWRALVPPIAHEVARATGDDLIAVQAVLVESYWNEISRGFVELAQEVFHVVLHAGETELRARIASDEAERTAAEWRLDHVAPYLGAHAWLVRRADLVIDTSAVPAERAAAEILAELARAR